LPFPLTKKKFGKVENGHTIVEAEQFGINYKIYFFDANKARAFQGTAMWQIYDDVYM
jgi:hypothetical protein